MGVIVRNLNVLNYTVSALPTKDFAQKIVIAWSAKIRSNLLRKSKRLFRTL